MFLFAEAPGTLGITEISRALDISKAVVHRIVTTLATQGLIQSDPATQRYALGPGVLQLASAYLDKLDVRSLALASMHRLTEATNETTTLSVLSGGRRVYVDQVTPQREVKMSVQVASSFPLHAGASSKAFFAYLRDDEIEAIIRDTPLESMTSTTIVAKDELRSELRRIKEQGFAVSFGERQEGAASVAAPVLDRMHRPTAVISVCGPLERFKPNIAHAAALLVTATNEISARMGAVVAPRP